MAGTVPLAIAKELLWDIAYHPGGRHLVGISSSIDGEHLWAVDVAAGG